MNVVSPERNNHKTFSLNQHHLMNWVLREGTTSCAWRRPYVALRGCCTSSMRLTIPMEIERCRRDGWTAYAGGQHT